MDRPPHLDIDLNEAPSPPPSPPAAVPQSPPRGFAAPIFAPPPPLLLPPPPPPQPQPPANAQAQLLLAHQAREIALAYHRGESWRLAAATAIAAVTAGSSVEVPPPAQHPGVAGWGNPPPPCASCGLPELPGATIICDACERGFHESCVHVWGPLMRQPPPPPLPTPPGVRRPPVAVNEDWMCPACEIGGAHSKRWKLRAVPLDINAAPREDPVAITVGDITRVSVADGAHLTELATPRFEGLQLNNTTPFDGNHFMPAFGLPHCFSIRQQFPPVDQNFIADGNIEQRSNHTRRRRRDFPQTSALPKFSEKHEFVSSSILMEPSFFMKATAPSPTEERNPLKPPKFLAENCNRQPHHRSVGLPVQYQDFFITSLGEIDKQASYHNCHQIWPVGFTSYWHDRVTGSLFECEVCDGGSFGPLFKVRRLPCSAFPLPEASTILSQNGARKADTIETKESSSFIGDAANDMDDDLYMIRDVPSETNQDFLSCLTNDTEDKMTSLGCNDVQSSNMVSQILPSNSENVPPSKEANINDQIGEFTFEGTSSSSVWRMISCAMVEACEKMYKEHGHLVFSCTHSSGNHLLNKGSGCQNFDGPYAPLTRFCSSNGPSIPRIIEKKNDVESTYTLLKKWLYHDRIGLDLEFVQEIVESLPRSRSCINYQFLCNRAEFHSSMTVASGLLISVHKDGQSNGDMSYDRHGAVTGLHDHVQPSSSSIRELPPGRPISHKLPPESAGDVFQIWEFLGRFAEIIGLKEVPSYEQLEDELVDPWPVCGNQKETLLKGIQQCRDYSSPMNSPANVSISHSNSESGLSNNEEIVSVFIPVETSSMKEAGQDKLAAQTLGRCTGVVLPGVHLALFKVLFGELLSKVAVFVDPNIDPKESKPRRGRKKDTESLISTKEFNFDMLTANKLTWPELARRYMLAISSINGCMDVSDISSREGVKLFRCLQGDGGILCGAVPGVAGMEKDALLLLEAENLICSSLSSEGNKVFMMDYKYTGMIDSAEVPIADNRTLPDWAEPLEPVRKLPTNVGTRIRKCVYEALDRKPPEWARKILEHSISKEVYKGNASGPTKKAVLSVLSEACRVIVPQKPENPRNERKTISISEVILKKCRIALRHAISSDESKLFGNLLGTTLMNSNENEDEGILGFSGMVPRPLDFRTIDTRLAMGAYCGSWETFFEDVQEVIRNLHTAFADRADVVEMVAELSQSLESLYKTEVLDLVQKFDCHLSNENTDSEIHEELHEILTAATKLPKAPWEEGVCKVCGIDRDDESVLLCDECDSEYHTYCLNPPLARIPQGDWFCPSCILKPKKKSRLDQGAQDSKRQRKGAESHVHDKPSCMSGQKKSHPDQGVQDLKRQRKGAFHDILIKLTVAMEQKEYWELSTQERINMLKFLCDEMLNTVLVREHIEKCPDKLNDLQQKFRALNFELKDLKYKEEMRTSYARQSRWSKTEQHVSNCSGLAENQQNEVAIASDHLEESEQGNTGVNLNQPAEGTPPGQLNVGKPCKSDNGMSMVEENKSLELSEQPSGTGSDRIEGNIMNERSRDNFNLVDTPIAEREPVATPLSTPGGELPDENASASQDNLKMSTTRSLEQAADNGEMDTLSDEISKVQESIGTVESQLNMSSLRRDCLGKDSLGRLYWVLGRSGKRPLLVADGSMLICKERDINMVNSYPPSTSDCKGWNSASVVIYESDDEIRSLVDWLREYDPREKELKDAIQQWQRHLYHLGNFVLSDPPISKGSNSEQQLMDLPSTKAGAILEKTCRCDCLEPIWPAQHHCVACHETYSTSTEYEEHAGKCNGDVKEKDSVDPSSTAESRKLKSCPYDFEEICRKFTTNDSNKEIVKDIGLIGSNGVPSFVPSPASYLEPPVILNKNKKDDIPNDWVSSLEECQAMSAQKLGQEGSNSGQNCPGSTGDENVSKSKKPASDSTSCEEASSATDKPTRLLAVNGGLVPESSLRPVIGRNSHILKQQKINLLDIDAALPEEALRASKSQQIRRRSWRAFVKHAESISEMVLATSVLENMIKSEFLKNDWWYWSSFTVAMKTSTVSSLALRIYTLDDCIMYTKEPNTMVADSTKVVNKGKRRKEPEPSAS
ncbi:hypothetical protein CFC21_083104 [Triticum aestivum]|uniref:Methyl-CpG-binding domain-containing protein 9 n=2 Tax=Triticum aestivum TaxID=4565 RepID=A0A9R1I7Z1_WHEAT|nr:methyl-CpG-binding domain-containing protein 9-like isoform X2 [Triticum aestivum]KAF7078718.1 hypothetical protein CFC21_083104 [Triticum aestivum]